MRENAFLRKKAFKNGQKSERKWSQQQVADLLHVLSFDVYRDVISLLIGLTFIVQGVTITVLKYRI